MSDNQAVHDIDGETTATDVVVGKAEDSEKQQQGKWARLFNNLARPITAPYRGLKYLYNHPVKGTFNVLAVVGGGVGLAAAKAHYIDGVALNALNWENLGHLAANFGPTFAIATGTGSFFGYMSGRLVNTVFDENFQHYSTQKAGKYIGAFLACWAALYGNDYGKDYSKVYYDMTVNAPQTMQNIANAQHDFWFPERVNTATDPKWEIADQPNCLYQDLINPGRKNKCRVQPEAEGMKLIVPGIK